MFRGEANESGRSLASCQETAGLLRWNKAFHIRELPGRVWGVIVTHLSRVRKAQIIVALVVLIGAVTVIWITESRRTPSLNGAFSNVAITAASGSGPIYPWKQIKVTADWKVPDRTAAGTAFSLGWPTSQLKGIGGTLVLKTTDNDTIENCSLGASSLDCVLTSYVTTHPYDIKGTVWFTLTQVNIPENSTVTIPFVSGSTTIAAAYSTTGSVATTFTGIGYYKDVWVHDGTVTWYVYLPGDKTGQAADYTGVVVAETLGGDQTYQQAFLPGTFSLEHATKLNTAGTWPVWETASTKLYTVTPTGSSSFTLTAPKLAAGGWWRLVYNVTVSPSAYKGTISDTAKASWDGQKTLSATYSEVYVDAGGTGSGQAR